MFFTGTDALLDIIAAALQSEENQNREISQQIFRCESEEHQKMEDIVRLPLKLPFPSLPLRSVPEPEFHCTERVAGPDGNVCHFLLFLLPLCSCVDSGVWESVGEAYLLGGRLSLWTFHQYLPYGYSEQRIRKRILLPGW